LPGTLRVKGFGVVSILSFVRSVGTAGFHPPLGWSDGFAGICTDLSVRNLRAAYAKGLYPSCGIGQQTWWAPGMRMVLFMENFHIEPAVRRRLRRKEFRVTFDRDFTAVVSACAEARAERMSPDIIAAFMAAHSAGLAHSVEVLDRSGALAGGIFGLAIGKVFFTEGHFSWARDASKAGFTALNCHLQRWGYLLNDGKRLSGRLCQFGFTPISRNSFNALLAEACTRPGHDGRWAVDQSLNLAGWNPRAMSGLH
jgi:leucyl/phenylalanyl-tRNA---protein transferase